MQNILYGLGNITASLRGCRKVFLVCGRSYYTLCICKDIERIGIPLVVFSDFSPNPKYEEVEKGVGIFQHEGCDSILAVGGGSAIDVAKCIKLFCRMDQTKLYMQQEYKDTGIRLFAVPTTAGTGSESTRYAVIYYQGEKQSITNESIIPDIAILEPKVLRSLPLYQKKCTMLDALCQGIESWWSVNSTEESRQYSEVAVRTIMKWWYEYIFEGTDDSAKHIMDAANYAGRAINITQTTAPHAFSYKLSSLYGIPHGHAVAVCLPEIWRYMICNMDLCIDHRGSDFIRAVFYDIASAMACQSSEAAIELFYKIMFEMDLHKPQCTHREEEIKTLTASVNPIRLKNNPMKIDTQTILKLYKNIVR